MPKMKIKKEKRIEGKSFLLGHFFSSPKITIIHIPFKMLKLVSVWIALNVCIYTFC